MRISTNLLFFLIICSGLVTESQQIDGLTGKLFKGESSVAKPDGSKSNGEYSPATVLENKIKYGRGGGMCRCPDGKEYPAGGVRLSKYGCGQLVHVIINMMTTVNNYKRGLFVLTVKP